MKQSNYIPRRVGTSLIRSLAFYADSIVTVAQEANNDDDYHKKNPNHPSHTNKRLVLQKDLDTCESIKKFYAQMTVLMDEEKIPSGAFITIANHKQDKTKYVATPTSFGLVTTTATLKRILSLVTNMVKHQKSLDNKQNGLTVNISIAEAQYEGYRWDCSPHFLRIADVIRYLNETEADVIEMNLDGIHHDYKIEQSFYRNGNYYSRRSDKDAVLHVTKMSPMISDRYQDDSWGHYLDTLYSGLTEPNKYCPTATPVIKSICVSELKSLETA